MVELTGMTVREIALAAPATTRVFEEFKIDYCCGGRRSIEDACEAAGVDADAVEQRLSAVLDAGVATGVDPERLPTAELIDHILATHHIFTATEIGRLLPLMSKVVLRHGDAHPELYDLQQVFEVMADSLLLHMRKEENILFPFVRATAQGANVPIAHFGTVANPIRMMEADHDDDGERLRRMREITANYHLPEGACPSFTALYAGLEDLERDLHRHIHLENNVLFPAAIEMDRSRSVGAA